MVDRLLGRRVLADGREQYLVRWHRHGPEYESWEVKENILDVTLIHELHALLQMQQPRGDSDSPQNNTVGPPSSSAPHTDAPPILEVD